MKYGLWKSMAKAAAKAALPKSDLEIEAKIKQFTMKKQILNLISGIGELK